MFFWSLDEFSGKGSQMKVLILGSGGREHALAWAIRAQPARDGNRLRAGQRRHGPKIPLRPCRSQRPQRHGPPRRGRAARSHHRRARSCRFRWALSTRSASAACASLVPRAPPPCSKPARALPSSFSSATTFLRPTTPSARALLKSRRPSSMFHPPIVVKADGLFAGKGVIICASRNTAAEAAQGLFSGALLGEAAHQVVIEEFLEGDEVSFLCLSDGKHVTPLAAGAGSQAHRRGRHRPQHRRHGGLLH